MSQLTDTLRLATEIKQARHQSEMASAMNRQLMLQAEAANRQSTLAEVRVNLVKIEHYPNAIARLRGTNPVYCAWVCLFTDRALSDWPYNDHSIVSETDDIRLLKSCVSMLRDTHRSIVTNELGGNDSAIIEFEKAIVNREISENYIALSRKEKTLKSQEKEDSTKRKKGKKLSMKIFLFSAITIILSFIPPATGFGQPDEGPSTFAMSGFCIGSSMLLCSAVLFISSFENSVYSVQLNRTRAEMKEIKSALRSPPGVNMREYHSEWDRKVKLELPSSESDWVEQW